MPIRMLNSGVSLDVISEIYRVKPNSIKIALWRAKNFSFVEAKRIAVKASKARLAAKPQKNTKACFDW